MSDTLFKKQSLKRNITNLQSSDSSDDGTEKQTQRDDTVVTENSLLPVPRSWSEAQISFQQADKRNQRSFWYRLGIVQNDNGVFHLNQKYYKSKYSVIVAVILACIMIPLIVQEILSFGSIKAETEYHQMISRATKDREVIKPTMDVFKGQVGMEKYDNEGLWPLYIYNYGMKCDQIQYTIIIK